MALNLITDVPGLTVGHATDLALGSGVTAMLFAAAATMSVAVLGGAPGGRDSGAGAGDDRRRRRCGGAVRRLGVRPGRRRRGAGGVARGRARLPCRRAGAAGQRAILFDLRTAAQPWGRFSPYRDLGYAAAWRRGRARSRSAASAPGAGRPRRRSRAGWAPQHGDPGRPYVGALAAVNAVGSPTAGRRAMVLGRPVRAGGRVRRPRLAGGDAGDRVAPRVKRRPGPSTTIGLVATDAALTSRRPSGWRSWRMTGWRARCCRRTRRWTATPCSPPPPAAVPWPTTST